MGRVALCRECLQSIFGLGSVARRHDVQTIAELVEDVAQAGQVGDVAQKVAIEDVKALEESLAFVSVHVDAAVLVGGELLF